MSAPRVLVLTPDYPPLHGGVQLLVHRLVTSMSRVRPSVVTYASPGWERFDARASVPVHRTAATSGWPSTARVVALNGRGLAEAVRQRPDIVLSAHIVAAPAAAAARRLLGVPFVQYLHAEEVVRHAGRARRALERAAAVIVVSRHTRALAAALGTPDAKLHLIAPGVDAAPPPSPGEPDGPPTMVTVSRLHDRFKGHDVVLRALPLIARHVPEVLWVVIGDGRLRAALERQAAALGVAERVRFTGVLDDAARDRLVERAQLFLMPSRLSPGGGGEGYGIVFSEAQARGVPVVAGDVGGALDSVAAGLLVDPTDHVAVAEAVIDLLANAARRRRLSLRAREQTRRRSWFTMARQVEDVLLGVGRAA